jgi:23S rRNA pseudouridine1911/1915/1917 synthase
VSKRRKGPAVDVLYADNHVLAVDKPAGVPMVPDASGDESLLDRAKDWIRFEKKKPGEIFLGVVHRLDRPVSGVALFARTSKAAERLSRSFRERDAHKTYWGLVTPPPRGERGEVEQWLAKDEDSNRARPAGPRTPGAKLARTGWRLLVLDGRFALLELEPETGRPHQIRSALRSLGSPLLGDLKYGAQAPLEDRSIALHARRLEIAHPTRGDRLEIECLPPDRPWWELARRLGSRQT